MSGEVGGKGGPSSAGLHYETPLMVIYFYMTVVDGYRQLAPAYFYPVGSWVGPTTFWVFRPHNHGGLNWSVVLQYKQYACHKLFFVFRGFFRPLGIIFFMPRESGKPRVVWHAIRHVIAQHMLDYFLPWGVPFWDLKFYLHGFLLS